MRQFVLRGGADFYTGLLLLAITAIAIWYLSGLEIGTARAMGPGYFPLGLALILGALGLFLVVRGIMSGDTTVAPMEIKPLALILLSFAVFALLIDRIGLIGAILAQVVTGHFASRETSFLQSLVFGLVLAGASAVVFVWLLNMPVELLP